MLYHDNQDTKNVISQIGKPVAHEACDVVIPCDTTVAHRQEMPLCLRPYEYVNSAPL